jgi:hypothetical protein
MRRLSLNARTAHDAVGSKEVEVVLLHITHPETEQVIRLSTDPTDRISYNPPAYGTRSTWQDSDPADDDEAFLFILMSVMVPDDQEDSPPAAQLVLEAVDNRIVDALRSTLQRATVSMALVLASTPDLVEQEWLNFKLISAEGGGDTINLTISRDPVTAEPWPAGRMTRDRFPGLHP